MIANIKLSTSNREQITAISSLARRLVKAASEKQASDVLLLDIRAIASFSDYLVLMTADNTRQIAALAAEIPRTVRNLGGTVRHVEGEPDSGWILLDCMDVIVHIFSPDQRALYSLEEVWEQSKVVLRFQ